MALKGRTTTAKDYRRMALGMADAVEPEHMGHPDFRAPGPNGRIFAKKKKSKWRT
jgi:hypothetical protein